MTIFENGDVRINYEVTGEGFPVLLIAPGGMNSVAAWWDRMQWNPRAALVDNYQVISMDQRNAGGSTAPVTAADSWDSYTADQLALMDHLGHERFAVAGMCIGGPYIMGLAQAAPDRVAGAIMLQPIGLDENHQAFYDMFDTWADELKADHPEADDAAWQSFRSNMYDGPFMFNTTREQAATVQTPVILLMGDDMYHPESTSRELADLLPNVTFVESWKEGDDLAAANTAILDFLSQHTA